MIFVLVWFELLEESQTSREIVLASEGVSWQVNVNLPKEEVFDVEFFFEIGHWGEDWMVWVAETLKKSWDLLEVNVKVVGDNQFVILDFSTIGEFDD